MSYCLNPTDTEVNSEFLVVEILNYIFKNDRDLTSQGYWEVERYGSSYTLSYYLFTPSTIQYAPTTSYTHYHFNSLFIIALMFTIWAPTMCYNMCIFF